MNSSVIGSGDLDVVVIGAGAAGLAAANRLAAANVRFCVLDARDRVGGRAFTQLAGTFPLDRGCGWLHSADRNPWLPLFEAKGFTIDRNLPGWRTQAFGIGFNQGEREAFFSTSEHFSERLKAAAQMAEDQPAARLLDTGGRWNGLLDAVSTYVNGVELDHVSVYDFANYADTGINWRVMEGYGAGIAAHATGLPIVLDCAVKLIDRKGPRLQLETSRGVVSARKLILTVPPTLLATEALRFDPPLPAKLEAAAVLPLGLANKLFIAIDSPDELPIDGHLFGRTDSVATPSYHLRPFGRPLIEAYFGGQLAQDLEEAGPDGFFAFAVEQLVGLFGSAIRPRLHQLAATGWRHDPFALGSYSYALPGHSAARAALAAPVEDRIFFAGEACSKHDFSTAHGAYRTGLAAAEQTLTALAVRSPAA